MLKKVNLNKILNRMLSLEDVVGESPYSGRVLKVKDIIKKIYDRSAINRDFNISIKKYGEYNEKFYEIKAEIVSAPLGTNSPTVKIIFKYKYRIEYLHGLGEMNIFSEKMAQKKIITDVIRDGEHVEVEFDFIDEEFEIEDIIKDTLERYIKFELSSTI